MFLGVYLGTGREEGVRIILEMGFAFPFDDILTTLVLRIPICPQISKPNPHFFHRRENGFLNNFLTGFTLSLPKMSTLLLPLQAAYLPIHIS